ncbi:MAG: hypothetical protein RLZZ297_1828 [Chloroflexota bacterium]|jgi:NagD protein
MPVPIRACIFDLDGTVYLGDQALPGVVAALARLRAASIPFLFLSNNPTKTPAEYVAKLTHMGIPVGEDDVLTSAVIMVDWFRSLAPAPVVFPIAEPALLELLTAAGIRLSDKYDEITHVLASFDRTFAYPKLQVAFDAMRAGATLVATNPDKYCPVPGGGQPDCAAIIAAIEACTDTKLAFTAGKPSLLAAQAAAQRLGVPLEACLMVGDRLETDVSMGATGMQSALVMTGATDAATLAAWRGHAPDYVYASVVECVDQVRAGAHDPAAI